MEIKYKIPEKAQLTIKFSQRHTSMIFKKSIDYLPEQNLLELCLNQAFFSL